MWGYSGNLCSYLRNHKVEKINTSIFSKSVLPVIWVLMNISEVII